MIESRTSIGRPAYSPGTSLLFITVLIASLFRGIVAFGADPATPDAPEVNLGTIAAPVEATPFNLGLASNPRAASGFLGNGMLGQALGLDKYGITFGGVVAGSGNWLIAGGVKPKSTSGTAVLSFSLKVDTEKAFGLPGGEFLAQWAGWTGQNVNGDAGSVQNYNSLATQTPFDRNELVQLWYRQRFFNDRLIVEIGKINATGDFDAALSTVPVAQPFLQDWTISGLLFVPPAVNPTTFGRLPGYPNTAWGIEATVAPTKQFYASFGAFDGNNARGFQTGLYAGPHVNTYKFYIGEIGYDWRIGAQGKPGMVGVGVWGQTGRLLTPNLTFENGATGFYAFGNQRLWYRHPGKDTSGIVGFLQYGYTGDQASEISEYVGGGLTAVGLVPRRPADSMGIGVAWSRLNHAPFAGAFFFPNVSSASTALRNSEFMMQIYYQAVLIPWTLAVMPAYTYIPTPGARPTLPAAHVLTAQVALLF